MVEGYLTIADATWMNLILHVSNFITILGGKTEIMPNEIVRTNFEEFSKKYKKEPISKVGNVPQFKIHE